MKAILKILYFFLVLILLFLLAGIFMPKSTSITVEKKLGASTNLAFDQINDISKWPDWLTWFNADSSVNIFFSNITKGKGASYSWSGKNLGTGKMVIVSSVPDTIINILITYGDKNSANIKFELKKSGYGSKIKWTYYDDTLSYFERYFVTLFINNMRNSMQSGLDKLEEVTNETRLSRISSIHLVTLESQPAMIIRDSSKIEDIDSIMQYQFDKLNAYLERRNIKPSGSPFIIYYERVQDGYTKFACGFPIPERTWSWKQYEYLQLPAGEAAAVTHWGLYSSEKPYVELDNYMKQHNKTFSGFIIEYHIITPLVTSDTSRWEKQIFYPVAKEMEGQ